MSEQLNHAVTACLSTALWSSVDDNDVPLNQNYEIKDIASDSYHEVLRECNVMLTVAMLVWRLTDLDGVDKTEGSDVAEALRDYFTHEYVAGQIGHDFWLTRNGHGTGFWDRGLGNVGDALTEVAESFCEVSLIVGDDSLLHLE